ncbi:trans-1,2-dihydrobenzene-1,2-diol dehydrogenase [Scaptodrosophila lebanonensis]|uniref:Trans-1,2-dihydrobenzene-1,2-diol dehydrogenase n=1 Tax=Drosophila lebanonensis TaxID=7225 RepID=A0A6J2U8D2_DROLE|nr:trans-1,2-dihydrobenzene-1,2-diol dehydrogenase [Scaptodrosophila lebanonensis]
MWQLLNTFKTQLPKSTNNAYKALQTQKLLHATRACSTPGGGRLDTPGTKTRIFSLANKRELHVNEFPDFTKKRQEVSPFRWGIAPVSLMANDFATALSVLPPQNHKIMSCVAPHRSQALAFAKKYDVRNVYTNYEDLARCTDVDAVYISPLNPLHCELCNLMLNHDKHVLCEKPLCMAEHQVENLLQKARERNLFLMEGMWPRCVPAYHYLRRQIMRNCFGRVHSVDCTLGLVVPSNKLALYGGVTNDFAVYGIQLALWVFRAIPLRIKTSGRLNEEDIDVMANIELTFSDDRKARILVSAENKLSNEAIIVGTKGSIKLRNYWCPTRMLDSNNTEYEFPLPETQTSTHYHNRIGICYEAEEVRNCVLSERIESELFSHKESLLLANITDTIHELLGVGRETPFETEFDEELALAEKSGSSLTVATKSNLSMGRAQKVINRVLGLN